MRWATAIALAAFGLTAALPNAQERGQPAPAFRSGVDIVTLDVSVLDSKRRPVRGLRAEDFTILEGDRPQTIEAFTAVDVPAPIEGGAPWTREIGADVVSNELNARRLVVFVIDDAHMRMGAPAVTAKRILNDAIDRLGPSDLAAVVYTDIGRGQNFTMDRARLRAAVDSLVPHWDSLSCRLKRGGCDVNTLTHIARVLRDAPGRKTLFYVSSGRAIAFPEVDPDAIDDVFTQRHYIQELFDVLQQANVTIFAFDPAGLEVGGADASDRKPRMIRIDRNESLHSFAASTGGRAVTDTNEPWAMVADAFQESSAYYLLGYRSTNRSRDGRFRRVRIAVNRADVEVRSRAGYFAPKDSRPRQEKPAVDRLDLATSGGLPTGDVRITAMAAPFWSARSQRAQVAIVAAIRDRVDAALLEKPQRRRVRMMATAFDDGWRSRGTHTQTLDLTLRPSASGEIGYEVLSRLPLARGRYEIRVAAESDGRAGSVFLDVDVPDFAKEALSVSGVLLQRQPGGSAVPPGLLEELVPIVPTTIRDFARTDRVSGFMRVYLGGKPPASPVTVTMRILDASDRAVVEESMAMAPDRFDSNRAADYQWSLPVDRLSPGAYVLNIDVVRENKRVFRHVRFAVN